LLLRFLQANYPTWLALPSRSGNIIVSFSLRKANFFYTARNKKQEAESASVVEEDVKETFQQNSVRVSFEADNSGSNNYNVLNNGNDLTVSQGSIVHENEIHLPRSASGSEFCARNCCYSGLK